jgi:hypothetical protein
MKIDLHSSSKEEYKQDVIAKIKEDFAKYGEESLGGLLDYLFDKAYLKGEVDERQFRDKIQGLESK